MRKSFGIDSWMFPLPVLIIGTYDEEGNPNAMNAAWGGIYDTNMVTLCLSHDHKTFKNIMATKCFTVSFADTLHVREADFVGIVSGNDDTEKVRRAALVPEKSSVINAPLFGKFPVAIECTLEKIGEDGNVIGNIVNISIDEEVLDENGKLDMEKFVPIAFNPVLNTYMEVRNNVGDAFDIGNYLR